MIIQTLLLRIKIQPNKSEQERKRQSVYDLLKARTKPNVLCQPNTERRFLFIEKEIFKEKLEWRIEEKTKTRLFNYFRYCS